MPRLGTTIHCTTSLTTSNLSLAQANEVRRILADNGATRGPTAEQSLVQLNVFNVDLPEIQEVNTEAIAKDKALLASQLAGGSCLVEDTSLQFTGTYVLWSCRKASVDAFVLYLAHAHTITALGDMPGPYIKWFQDRLKSEGLYNILAAYEDKSATAVCTLAFCPAPHADPVLFTGKCSGHIVAPQPGAGFGWDSIFVPEGTDKPFSKMTMDEKNALSHRGKAVRQWAFWLSKNQEVLWELQQGKRMIGHKGLDFKVQYPEQ